MNGSLTNTSHTSTDPENFVKINLVVSEIMGEIDGSWRNLRFISTTKFLGVGRKTFESRF